MFYQCYFFAYHVYIYIYPYFNNSLYIPCYVAFLIIGMRFFSRLHFFHITHVRVFGIFNLNIICSTCFFIINMSWFSWLHLPIKNHFHYKYCRSVINCFSVMFNVHIRIFLYIYITRLRFPLQIMFNLNTFSYITYKIIYIPTTCY